jgi:hypothetical protein
MYVVDAVDGRDCLFEMEGAASAPGRQLEVTQATARSGRAFIREHVDRIADLYHYKRAGRRDRQ